MDSAEISSSSPALLVFSDDWGRHPSSCQHLVHHFLNEHRTIWVNTIGMRPPRLNWTTFHRGFGKLADWFGPAPCERQLHCNLSVVQPLMWPWIRSRFDRTINRRLLANRLVRELRSLNSCVYAITTIPIVADIMDELPVDRWIYYCVDDFSVWPGLSQHSLSVMEEVVVSKADRLIAVSEVLQERLCQSRKDVHLLTHGIHLEHWRPELTHPRPSVLVELPQPIITFWGLIDRRMDIAWLRALSRELTAGTIVLAGPEDSPPRELASIDRVVRIGRVSYEELPAIAAHSDVLIMPYADLPVTRAMQPLKLLEYLATDRPVVVRDLPAARPWSDCLDLADSPQQFAQIVCNRIRSRLPNSQRLARGRVVAESWEAKATQFKEIALSKS